MKDYEAIHEKLCKELDELSEQLNGDPIHDRDIEIKRHKLALKIDRNFREMMESF